MATESLPERKRFVNGEEFNEVYVRTVFRWRGSETIMGAHVVVSVLIGGALGLGYQHFIGCRSGSCAITSNPVISTLYGALMGYLLSSSTR